MTGKEGTTNEDTTCGLMETAEKMDLFNEQKQIIEEEEFVPLNQIT